MNKLNRTAHEGRTLWTIDPLHPDEGAALRQILSGETSARLSLPLANACLAGANRAVAVILPKPAQVGHGTRTPRAVTELRRPVASVPSSGKMPLVLLSHPTGLSSSLAAGDGTASQRKGSADGTWLRLGCQTADGQEDVLYLHFDSGPPAPDMLQRDLSIWPTLRNRCLDALFNVREDDEGHADGPDAALLWIVLSKIPAAVLVVNAAGLILRMNPQARRLIREGRVLARGRGGLTASTDQGTRLLRETVKRCLAMETSEQSLLLPTTDGSRVPATVFRLSAGGISNDLVTLIIPVPPEPDQVERMARNLGLTATEARVASLLQRGMSNRVAAMNMGVQEQSFATYSKRVLSKLNVTSRAEIAQMLTWQSSLPSTEGFSS